MSPFRTLPLVVLLCLATAIPARAEAASPVSRAHEALHDAVGKFKAAPVLKARAAYVALSAAEPKVAAFHYWVAYADWRAVPLMADSERTRAERYAKDGLDHCDQALALAPENAEALALKGSLQGIAIRFDPKSMMTLGVQGMMNLRRAIALDPANPRVRLLNAISILNKPAEFGGGAAAADSVFHKAITLFEKAAAPADSTAPDWGGDDALLWAGRCASQLGDWTRARDLFREALRVNSANVWVKYVLLPEAEKALAAKASAP